MNNIENFKIGDNYFDNNGICGKIIEIHLYCPNKFLVVDFIHEHYYKKVFKNDADKSFHELFDYTQIKLNKSINHGVGSPAS